MKGTEGEKYFNMEKKFNVGDIVRLKSGGPEMIIKEYVVECRDRLLNPKIPNSYLETTTRVKCHYFAGTEIKLSTFEQDEVELV